MIGVENDRKDILRENVEPGSGSVLMVECHGFDDG
jgi:hypothetical protein